MRSTYFSSPVPSSGRYIDSVDDVNAVTSLIKHGLLIMEFLSTLRLIFGVSRIFDVNIYGNVYLFTRLNDY